MGLRPDPHRATDASGVVKAMRRGRRIAPAEGRAGGHGKGGAIGIGIPPPEGIERVGGLPDLRALGKLLKPGAHDVARQMLRLVADPQRKPNDPVLVPSLLFSEVAAQIGETRLNLGFGKNSIDIAIEPRDASTLVVSPAEFGSHVEAETEKWGKVVKFLGVKPN